MSFDDLIPCLAKNYKLLKRAIDNEVVFITGPPSTGKTTLAKRVFQEDEFKNLYLAAYVDCYSVASPARLFSTICQFYHSTLNVPRSRAKKTGIQLPEVGDPVNLADFPRFFNEYCKIAQEAGYKSLYAIIDHVEVFEKTNMMDSFVALCRIVTQSIQSLRLVVVSFEDPQDIVHSIIQKSTAIGYSFQDRMQVISCNVWSREDIVDWILKLPPKIEEELYRKFVKHIVTLVYTNESRDARHIRMYCQQNFAEFVDFYHSESRIQIRKMLKLDQDDSLPMETYTLGEMFNTATVQKFLNSRCTMVDKRRKNFRWTHEDTEIKMPSNTQILIVAAYIAAYTKPSHDKLNFVTFQKKKKVRQTRNPEHINRPFTLERIVQIYLALNKNITGDRKLTLLLNNDCVLSDIERLENLNILQHHSGYELSSDAKYKLSHNIKRNYVKRLADNVDLDLEWISGLQTE